MFNVEQLRAFGKLLNQYGTAIEFEEPEGEDAAADGPCFCVNGCSIDIYENGDVYWYDSFDFKHRLDGPAVTFPDGLTCRWFIHGVEYRDEAAYWTATKSHQ